MIQPKPSVRLGWCGSNRPVNLRAVDRRGCVEKPRHVVFADARPHRVQSRVQLRGDTTGGHLVADVLGCGEHGGGVGAGIAQGFVLAQVRQELPVFGAEDRRRCWWCDE